MLAYVNGQVVNVDGPNPTLSDALAAAGTDVPPDSSLLATTGRATRRAQRSDRLHSNTRLTTAPRVYAG